MATFEHDLTEDWELIQSGPASNISIQASSVRIIYTIQDTLPTDNRQLGHNLNPYGGTVIQLTGSDNLYARTSSDSTPTVLIRTV